MLDKEFQAEIKERIKIIIHELEQKAIEREVLARLMVLCIVSKTHMFLVGDPGVGKSYLIKRIIHSVKDIKYFEHLMTFSTQPEEILGVPYVDNNGNTLYNIKNSLIDCDIAFLDEVMKSRSVILNALLGVLGKERIFHMRGDSGGPVETNLMTAFSASNEFEQSSDLGALGDRFHIRYEPSRIKTKTGFQRFMRGEFDKSDDFSVQLTKEEIGYIFEASKEIEIPDYILDIITLLKGHFSSAKLKASDRKIEDSRDIMRVSAFCNNRESINIGDLFIFLHTMWVDFGERSRVKDIFFATIFSTQENYKSKIESFEESLAQQQSYIKAEVGDIFNKRVTLNAEYIYQNFDGWRISIENLYKNFLNIKKNFQDILIKFKEIEKIEELVRQNIFMVDLLKEEELMVVNPYQRPFNEDLIKRCEDNVYKCNDGIKATKHFLDNCKGPEDYLEWTTIV